MEICEREIHRQREAEASYCIIKLYFYNGLCWWDSTCKALIGYSHFPGRERRALTTETNFYYFLNKIRNESPLDFNFTNINR